MRAAKMWAARLALLVLASPFVASVACLLYPAVWWVWRGCPELDWRDNWTGRVLVGAFLILAPVIVGGSMRFLGWIHGGGMGRLWRTAFPPKDGPTVF